MRENRFYTDSEIEVPAVTAGQMREIDRIAIEETGPNIYQMMENAGRNLALEVIDILQERACYLTRYSIRYRCDNRRRTRRCHKAHKNGNARPSEIGSFT